MLRYSSQSPRTKMKEYIFCVQLVILLTIFVSCLASEQASGSGPTVGPEVRKKLIKCPRVDDGIVCGSNGINYDGSCALREEQANDPNLKQVECPPGTRQPFDEVEDAWNDSETSIRSKRRVRNYQKNHSERFRRRLYQRGGKLKDDLGKSFEYDDSSDEADLYPKTDKKAVGRSVLGLGQRVGQSNNNRRGSDNDRDETNGPRRSSDSRRDYQQDQRGQRSDYGEYDERSGEYITWRKSGRRVDRPPKKLKGAAGKQYHSSRMNNKYKVANKKGPKSQAAPQRVYSILGKPDYDYTDSVHGRTVDIQRKQNNYKRLHAARITRPRDSYEEEEEMQGRRARKRTQPLRRLRKLQRGVAIADSDSRSLEELYSDHRHRELSHPVHHHHHHYHHYDLAPHQEHHQKSHTPTHPGHHSHEPHEHTHNHKSQSHPDTDTDTSETTSSRKNQQEETNNQNNSGQKKPLPATAGRMTPMSAAPPPIDSTETPSPAGTTKPKESPRGHIVGDNGSLLSVQKSDGQAVAILPPPKSGPEDNNKRLVLIVRK